MESNGSADITEQDDRNLCLRSTVNASSTATADIEHLPYEQGDFFEDYSVEKVQTHDVTMIIVPCASGFGMSDISYAEEKNYLLRWVGQQYGYSYIPQHYICEALEDRLGFPDEAVGSVSPWPALWQHIKTTPADLRGVFYTKYPRKKLFSKIMNFKTADLPRWNPKSIIGLRIGEENDV